MYTLLPKHHQWFWDPLANFSHRWVRVMERKNSKDIVFPKVLWKLVAGKRWDWVKPCCKSNSSAEGGKQKEMCRSSTDIQQSFQIQEILVRVLGAATPLFYILISIFMCILYLSLFWAYSSNWVLVGIVFLFPYESWRDCPFSLLSD